MHRVHSLVPGCPEMRATGSRSQDELASQARVCWIGRLHQDPIRSRGCGLIIFPSKSLGMFVFFKNVISVVFFQNSTSDRLLIKQLSAHPAASAGVRR